MKRYFIRAFKYLVWLLVLFTVIFLVMNLTGTSVVRGLDGIKSMMSASRGRMLIVVVVGLAALYPFIGFMRRSVSGDMVADRDAIMQAMEASGFIFAGESDGVMSFRAKTLLKRATMLFEDTVQVGAEQGNIVIEGIRREVVKIEYRLNSLLMSKRDR